VRTGNRREPSDSWSPWKRLASPADAIGATSRFLQYEVHLTARDASGSADAQRDRVHPPFDSASSDWGGALLSEARLSRAAQANSRRRSTLLRS
jgi:hypothetical protein